MGIASYSLISIICNERAERFWTSFLAKIAAAAKAVAATIEEIGGAIAAGGWVVLVTIAVVIIIGVIILGVIGYVALPVAAVKQSL